MNLREQGLARTMLVIAPLRVARTTWPDEVAKWAEFAHLRVAVLHGPKKDDLLKKADADIYVINPEGVFWLANKYFGRPLPFDVLVVDELTRFKNASSERHKRLLPRLKNGPRYRWGLTGSLAGDGNYEDVFGQQLLLDDGAALGRFITHYREKYFTKGFDGFSHTLNRGAEQTILARLAPYWFYMDPKDYSQLPDLVDVPVMLDMAAAQMTQYRKMRDKFVAELAEKHITAANAGGAYGKLAQMANGAVYDEGRNVHHLHDVKIEALDDLVEELNGEPLLVGYEFNHDLRRIQEWHASRFKRELPYLGNGTPAPKEREWIDAWNAGKLPVLAGHPASMGHGLNLQGANAKQICWFSMPWSFELFDQFVRRIRRAGNESGVVFNHMLIVRDTIDEDKLAARQQKSFTHDTLIRVLNEQILREKRESRSGAASPPVLEHAEMVQRLSRPAAAPATAPAPAPAPAPAAGWGAPPATATAGAPTANGWGAPPSAAEAEQRARIQQQIAPAPQEQVPASFGAGAQAAAANILSQDYGAVAGPAPQVTEEEKAKRKRRTKAEIEADEAAARAGAGHNEVVSASSSDPAGAPDVLSLGAVLTARVEILKIAFADPAMPLEDGFAAAEELWKWASAL